MSVEFKDTESSLADTLESIKGEIDGETITIRQLFSLIGEQGLLLFCMILIIPFLLPVSIPGVSTVFGLIILLIGTALMLNRLPWLPARLMDRTLATKDLLPAFDQGVKLFRRLDSFVKPRLLVLSHGATINRVNGFLLIVGAILLMFPLGLIPFSNTLPGLAILFLAAGMLQRDGLLILLGYLALIATVIYFGALAAAAVLAGQGLSSLLGSG